MSHILAIQVGGKPATRLSTGLSPHHPVAVWLLAVVVSLALTIAVATVS